MNRLLLVLAIMCAGCSKAGSDPASASASSAATSPDTPAATAASPSPPTLSAEDAIGPVTRYRWRLVDATTAKGLRMDVLLSRQEWPLQLDFGHARVTVNNTCNTLVASYAQTGATLHIAPLASALKACNDTKLAALDQAARAALQGMLTFTLDTTPKPRLTLVNAQGDTLAFSGEPNKEARPVGPAKQLVLEVAAGTKPCNHPTIPDKRCLQVRDVKYDANGKQVGTPGQFKNFFGDIEGFTHVQGMRSLLRVNRFKNPNASSGGSSNIYVLDTVIEAEKAGPKDG